MRNPTIKPAPHYQYLLELLAACVRTSKDLPPGLRAQIERVLNETEPEYLSVELKSLEKVLAGV